MTVESETSVAAPGTTQSSAERENGAETRATPADLTGAVPDAPSGDSDAAGSSQQLSNSGGTSSVRSDAVPLSPRDRARRQGTWLLGVRVRAALLVVLALLVGVLLVRPAGSAKTGDFSALAGQINTALSAQTGVTQSSGGYLPGTGILLASSLSGVQQGQLNDILGTAMSSFAGQLAGLPSAEAVSWQATLTGGGSGALTWLVRVPGSDVGDKTKWVVAPVAAGTGTAAVTGTAAASGAPSAAAATDGSVASGSASLPAATSAPGTTAAGSVAASGATTAGSELAVASGSTGASGTGSVAPSAAAAAGGPVKDDFSKDTGSWSAMTGTWALQGGTYRQTDNSGYDFISQLSTAVPASYTVTVKMQGLANSLNAGLMVGQPNLGSRQGATIVDLTGNNYVRWGAYDTTSGTYKFIGGANLGSVQNLKAWHTIGVVVAAKATTVEWDGRKIGSFPAITAGHVGLVTSQSAVEFDDFTVVAS